MGKGLLARSISEAADSYRVAKIMEISEKEESEIMTGKRKIKCGFCNKVDKRASSCSRIYVCAKDLCKNCSKKCKDCGKYFCPKHIINHKCK